MARRKGPVILVVCLGLAFAALAGAVVYRAALLEAGLLVALRGRGVPAALTVREVGWFGATLEDIALGAAAEVRVRRLRLTYDPVDLIQGRLSAIEIDGPVLKLDATGTAPLFGSLQPLLDGAPKSGNAPGDAPGDDLGDATSPIPAIVLSDARIEAATPLGTVNAMLSGLAGPAGPGAAQLSLDIVLDSDRGWGLGRLDAARAVDGRLSGTVLLEDGALALPGAEIHGLRGDATFAVRGGTVDSASAALTLGTLSLPGVAFERVRLDLRLGETELLVETELSTADEQLRLSANGRAQDLYTRPRIAMDARAEVTARAALWAILGIPAPTAGRATATASVETGLAARLDWSDPDLARVRSELIAAARGRVTLALDGVTYPDAVRGLTGQARIDAAPDPARPGALAGEVAVDATLEAAAVAGLRATGIALTQHAGLRADPDTISISAAEPGHVSARRLTYGNVLSSASSFAASIAELDAAIDRGKWTGTHTMSLIPDRIGVAIERAGAPDITIQADAAKVGLAGAYDADRGYAGTVRIENGDIAVPAVDVAVQGLDATLAIARDGVERADFTARAPRHGATVPSLAPLSLAGTVTRRHGAILLQATAAGPNGAGRVDIQGKHNPATNAGDLALTLTPLEFTPGGTQPGDLLPGLSDLRDVAGTARAGARIAWTAGAIDGSAEASIDDMSLTGAAGRIEGLSLAVRLDRLRPPGSPPGQTLRIARLDPGVPLSDLSVRFQIVPSEPPTVAIAAAEVHLAGGRFTMADVVVDPSSNRQHLPIQVDGLDLAETFRLLGVDGLSGQGRLSGKLPFLIRDTVPRIEDGYLAATAPGIIRVRSDYARQALAGAGESADLMLRALRDFYYDELTIAIDQPGADTARLGVTMLGKNPDVLDGYPFRFNIDLETDPQKLLEAVREAYRISNRAMRNLWIFGH